MNTNNTVRLEYYSVFSLSLKDSLIATDHEMLMLGATRVCGVGPEAATHTPLAPTMPSNKAASSSSRSLHRPRVHEQHDDPVVAALDKTLPHPYAALALSPDRQYAIAARKDFLEIIHIKPSGMQVVKTLPISHHFNTAMTLASKKHYERDSFAAIAFGQNKPTPATLGMNVTIHDVAWSGPQSTTESWPTSKTNHNTLVAAAASNAV